MLGRVPLHSKKVYVRFQFTEISSKSLLRLYFIDLNKLTKRISSSKKLKSNKRIRFLM